MLTQFNLNQIERKAFRSAYQDGLLDISLSTILGSMALMLVMLVRDDASWLYPALAFVGVLIGQLVFWAGKKFVTLPRLGQVTFGEIRRKRNKTLSIVLIAAVVVQVGIVLLTAGVWVIPAWGDALQKLFPERGADDLLVAAVSALFVGPPMMAVAYFSDFTRGYYIALVMAVGTFLSIWFWQPLIQAAAALLIFIPGVVLFLRFLRRYPPVAAEKP